MVCSVASVMGLCGVFISTSKRSEWKVLMILCWIQLLIAIAMLSLCSCDLLEEQNA